MSGSRLTAAHAGQAGGDAELQARVRARVATLLQDCAQLLRSHRAHSPQPELRFDLRGRAAGQCVWRKGQPPVLRFNLDIARHHRRDFLATTVAHEVAHLVTAACFPRARPHGREWQAVMRHLGVADPQRCHNYALDEHRLRRQRRWSYQCDCSEHLLSTTRHRRISEQAVRYLCQRCGSALRRSRDSGD